MKLELSPERAESLLLTDAELERRANQSFEEYRQKMDTKRIELGYLPTARIPKEKQPEFNERERQTWQKTREFHKTAMHDEFRAAFMWAKQQVYILKKTLPDILQKLRKKILFKRKSIKI